MTGNQTGESRLEVLRREFVGVLPERVALMRRLWSQLSAVPSERDTLTELHRHFHNLKGSGAAFGFSVLSSAAALGENLVVQLTQTDRQVSGGLVDRLGAALDQLETLIEGICSGRILLDGTAVEFSSLMRPESARQPSGGRRVFLCDDDRLALEQLAAQLTCFGYEVRCFTCVEDFCDAVRAQRPDCVVMDIQFPDSRNQGTEAISALNHETSPPLKTVFLSARADFEARLNAVQAGGAAYFVKPVKAINLAGTLDELTQEGEGEPYRILVVDDEPEIATYHCMVLEDAGMLTASVSEPGKVLPVLDSFRPDMVLMDMYMPGCSGADLAMVIRQMPDHFALPIVYLSSETDRHKQLIAMRIGADGFLSKPVIPADLVSAVAIRAERMRALRGMIVSDSLTGLFNHTATTQLLENAIATADRRRSELCFAMLDIDNFKRINDTRGHPVGDQVILALSRMLRQQLRSSDIVGRYGGEEFAIILQDASLSEALKLIDRLREHFAQVLFSAGEEDFSCSFSGGVARYAGDGSIESLIEAADRALYRAKEGGRNCIVASY